VKCCGKECQSTAWSEGHRFWCSAKDVKEDDHHSHHGQSSHRREQQDAADRERGQPQEVTVQGHLPGRAIEINVEVIRTVKPDTIPVTRADAPRTQRRRERERGRDRERVREVEMNNGEAARRVMESRRAALVPAAGLGADAWSHPNVAADSTSTSYVTPTSSTTAHAAGAKSSVARDRTVQPSGSGVAATQRQPRMTFLPTTGPSRPGLEGHTSTR
ncbi:hypothetical protein CVT26_011765, partial [Gymnopilus dilepis]